MNPTDDTHTQPTKTTESTTAVQEKESQDNKANIPGAVGEQGQQDIGGGAAAESYDTFDEAFREATGLGNVPAAGQATFDARAAETQAQMAEGISRGQVVAYTDSSGNQIVGGQYTNSEGTYFKTTDGNTYSVQSNNGSYTLESTKPGGQSIQAQQMSLVTDMFASPLNDSQTVSSMAAGAASGGNGSGRAEATAGPNAGSESPAAQPAQAMDAQTFYNQYKSASTPEAQQSVASYLTTLPADQQGQFIRQVADVAQTSDPTGARSVLTSLREDVRASASDSGAGDAPNQQANPTGATRPSEAGAAQSAPQGDATSQSPPANTPPQKIGDSTSTTTNPTSGARADAPQPPPNVVANPSQPGQGAQQQAGQTEKTVAVAQQPQPGQIAQPGQGQQLGAIQQPAQEQLPDRTLPPRQMAQPGQIPQPGQIAQPGQGAQPERVAQPGQGAQPERIAQPGQGAQPGQTVQPGAMPQAGQGPEKVPTVGQIPQPGMASAAALQAGAQAQEVGKAGGTNAVGTAAGTESQGMVLKGGVTEVGDATASNQSLNQNRTVQNDAAARAQALVLAQTIIPGLDLTTANNRQFLLDALKQLNAANLGSFDPRGPLVKQTLQAFDPGKVDALQGFLVRGMDSKGNVQVNEAAIGKMTAILSALAGLGSDQVTTPGATDLAVKPQLPAKPPSPLTLVAQMIQNEQQLLVRLSAGSNPFAMQSLIRLLSEQGQNLPAEEKAAPQLGTLISRGLTTAGTQTDKGSEGKATAELPTASFVTRLTPQQQQVINLMAGLNPHSEAKTQEAGHAPAPRQVETVNPIKPGQPAVKSGEEQAGATAHDISHAGDHAASSEAKELDNEKEQEAKSKADLEEGKPKPTDAAEHASEEDKVAPNAAMMALLAERQLKDLKDKVDKEASRIQQKKSEPDSRRRKYIVRDKDTLELIATTQLRDLRLAPLIYQLNKDVITTRDIGGKQVPDLTPRMVIWLPSQADIVEFRKRLVAGSSPGRRMTPEEELSLRFGAGWSGQPSGVTQPDPPTKKPADAQEDQLLESAQAIQDARRANVESMLGPLSGREEPADGRARQIVRLGDTLKSIAMKHPMIEDVMLWKLLAETNGMPTEVDDKGVPLSKLSRGMTLIIPAQEEIDAYRQRHNLPVPRLTRKSCPNCAHANIQSASICTGCGHVFQGAVAAAGQMSGQGADQNAAQNNIQSAVQSGSSPEAGSRREAQGSGNQIPPEGAAFFQTKPPVLSAREEMEPQPRHGYPDGVEPRVEQFDALTRVVRFETLLETPAEIWQIEVVRAGFWEPVISYEIFADKALRHEFSPDGVKRSVQLELQATAVSELANNDLHSNWKNYRDRYIAQSMSLST